jgi:hypothetical protein
MNVTRLIQDTPLAERTLLVEARVDDGTRRRLARGLPARVTEREAVLFLGYNYAEVPVGTSFDCCYLADDETQVRWVRSELVAVTQQLAQPWSEIPHGWKTVLAFDNAIPDLVATLPESDGWSVETRLLISSRQTWDERQHQAAAGAPIE